jgi:hypothetical protein
MNRLPMDQYLAYDFLELYRHCAHLVESLHAEQTSARAILFELATRASSRTFVMGLFACQAMRRRVQIISLLRAGAYAINPPILYRKV